MRLVRWFLLGCLAAAPAWAEDPDPKDIAIERIQHQGDGCEAGTVASMLSPDAKAFTVLFDSFVVDTSSGQRPGNGHGKGNGPAGDKKKSCHLTIDMKVPSGWSFAIFSADYRGYARLERNAVGSHRTFASFAGPHKEIGRLEIRGPRAEDYMHSTVNPLGEMEFSSCQGKTRQIRMHTDIQVKGTGLMTVDSLDGELRQRFGLAWRRCPTR